MVMTVTEKHEQLEFLDKVFGKKRTKNELKEDSGWSLARWTFGDTTNIALSNKVWEDR